MTDLFDRLYPTDPSEENIAVHYFFAALVDYAMGYTTRAQIVNYWSLDTDAEADLDVLCDAIDALSGSIAKLSYATELHSVMMFAAAGAKYTTKATFAARLGL
jgi:hypothetical protein